MLQRWNQMKYVIFTTLESYKIHVLESMSAAVTSADARILVGI